MTKARVKKNAMFDTLSQSARVFDRNLRNGRPPVLVFQMGKVGSTSVYETVRRALPQDSIFHIHVLTTESLNRISAKYEAAGKVVHPTITIRSLACVFTNQPPPLDHYLSSQLLLSRGALDAPVVKILTLVRDPFSTQLSHIFQNPHIHRPHLCDKQGNLIPDKVQNEINNYLASFNCQTDYVSNWYQREFAPALDIELLEQPFDHSQGFALYQHRNLEICVVTLESLQRNWEELASRFLHIEKRCTLKTLNSKDADDLYAAIKRQRFKPESLQPVYDSRFAKHFYSQSQRTEFIRKWCGSPHNT